MAQLESEDVERILNDLEEGFQKEYRHACDGLYDIKATRLKWQIITINMVQNRIEQLIRARNILKNEGGV